MYLQNDKKMVLEKYREHLSEGSPLPIYYQVAYILQHFLDFDVHEPGSRFFSEETIASQLDVSRPTVNKAINILIKNGYLKRDRGRNARIVGSQMVPFVMMNRLLSYGQMLNRIGKQYETVLIERILEVPPPKVAGKIGLAENQKVVHLKRMRSVDGEPLMLVDSYLPENRFSGLMTLDEKQFADDLYVILDRLFGVTVVRANRELMAARMSLEAAKRLRVDLWEPCLKMIGLAYTADDELVEYFVSSLKGSKCVLVSNLIKDE